MSPPPGVRGILLDIEGTTTPIAFVHETLFPFARARLNDYCARGDELPGVAEALELLRAEHAAETAERPAFGNGAPFAHHLMDQDRKSTGLKLLQGIIWEAGYLSGELKARLFDDVQPALEAWRRNGIRLRIFSSGSVLAQKLLFAHTEAGDLSGLIEGYHDTTNGPKREAASYRGIARAFALPAAEIVFLSDVVEELDAARDAGMQTGLVCRPGNKPVSSPTHPRLEHFYDLI